MPGKQGASKSIDRSKRKTHRGQQPGDKVITRHKPSGKVEHILPGRDLLSAMSRQRFNPSERPPRNSISHDELLRLVANATGTKVAERARWDQWSRGECTAAIQYLKSLVYGIDMPENVALNASDRVRASVEFEFTRTIWRKKRDVKNVILPGMAQDWFPAKYAEVQAAPATTVTSLESITPVTPTQSTAPVEVAIPAALKPIASGPLTPNQVRNEKRRAAKASTPKLLPAL